MRFRIKLACITLLAVFVIALFIHLSLSGKAHTQPVSLLPVSHETPAEKPPALITPTSTPPQTKKDILLSCPPTKTNAFGFGTLPDEQKANAAAFALDLATKDLIKDSASEKSATSGYSAAFLKAIEQRKTSFVETAYRKPSAMTADMLSGPLTQELNSVTENCIEHAVTMTGTLSVQHIDFEDGTTQDAYTLSTGKEEVTLHPLRGIPAEIESGTKVRITGMRLGEDLLFNGAVSASSSKDFLGGIDVLAQPGNPPALGEQKVAVILANFTDTKTPVLTREEVNDVVFHQSNDFYKENSYNKLSLSGKVFGWYTIPLEQTCDTGKIEKAAVLAADNDIDFTQFTRIIIYAPLSSECHFRGNGTIGKIPVDTHEGTLPLSMDTIRVADGRAAQVVEHELGHNFGNQHAGFFNCGKNAIGSADCSFNETGDRYDVMSCIYSAHQNALHKEYVGWFGDGDIITVTKSGTFTLLPIEKNVPGLKALKIPRKKDEFLYVEYRQPIGADKYLGEETNVFLGALLHITVPHDVLNRSGLIDATPPSNIKTPALEPGKTWRDPESGASVSVISADTSGLTVKVNLEKTDFTEPSVQITSPLPDAEVSGQVTVSVHASHPRGVKRVEFYYLKGENEVLFGSDDTEPFQSVIDTTRLPDGVNRVFAKAYDIDGNMGISPFTSIFVANNDKEKPTITLTSPLAATTSLPFTMSATALDDHGVYRVTFVIDGDKPTKGFSGFHFDDEDPPYRVHLDHFPLGRHTLYAEARDLSGRVSKTEVRTFTIVEQSGPPPAPLPLGILSSAALPAGKRNAFYSFFLDAEGGVPPYRGAIISGALPPGLSLDLSSGRISGIASDPGDYSFTIKITDGTGKNDTRTFTIHIEPS